MILTIRHETTYQYSAPVMYTIAQLRLWPRNEPQQRMLSWRIHGDGKYQGFIDAFGNQCHTLTLHARHQEIRIVAEGAVEVAALEQGRLLGPEPLSPLVFTLPTELTQPTAAVIDFAHQNDSGASSAGLLELAAEIRARVAYQSGATLVDTSADHALALGMGVCQDHAHLFIACCHVLGVPARYVSGYIDPGGSGHAASHAWVDVWVEHEGTPGWVSIDVTHARFQDDSYCRLAVGRDYAFAGPARGMRHGGGQESMQVRVDVTIQ